jgi:hypothetical protein
VLKGHVTMKYTDQRNKRSKHEDETVIFTEQKYEFMFLTNLLSETFIEINKDRKKGKDFREKLQRM